MSHKFGGLRVVALAGGVGGAKLADGLAQVMHGDQLTIVVNTGDDFEHLGLLICPDLDTVTYTLAGLANTETGWGRANDTYNALEMITQLGGADWFKIGDYDLGLHLERTRRLEAGESLSQVTRHICHQFGVQFTILPATDTRTPTQVYTDEGTLSFQEYFVHRQCQPRVTGFLFAGSSSAKPAPGVVEAIRAADLIVICPSNPWVSIDPILSIPGIRREVSQKLVIAVSPLIGGQAVKGPAAKMYAEMGIRPSALAVAQHYSGLLQGYVLDLADQELVPAVEKTGIHCRALQTLMTNPETRRQLGEDVLTFAKELLTRAE